ncbi:MAG: HK97 gp10 family phage protein [Myxococcota bacterium]
MGVVFDEARFDQAVRRALKALPNQVARVLRVSADGVVEETLRTWPVDTGNSASGWKAGITNAQQTSEDGVVEISITNDVNYAVYIEYGTARQQAGEHLQRALRRARRRAAQQLGQAVVTGWGAR